MLTQKYPPMMQRRYSSGQNCCLVLIDPNLLSASQRASRTSPVLLSGERHAIIFDERELRSADLAPLQQAVRQLREQGCEVIVEDHRGHSFGGAAYPLQAELREAERSEAVCAASAQGCELLERDEIVQTILEATIEAPQQVGDDLLNFQGSVGSAINAVDGILLRKATELEQQIVDLDDGLQMAKSKGFEQQNWG